MDLGTFYREFQNPPQLASLSLHVSAQSMADDLVTRLFLTVVSKKRSKRAERLPVTTAISCALVPQDSLPEKLAVYEKNIDEFDAFVDMLQ